VLRTEHHGLGASRRHAVQSEKSLRLNPAIPNRIKAAALATEATEPEGIGFKPQP